MSIEEAHKSSRGKSRESNDEDVENFLDMGVDFEALDEAILDVSSVHSVDQACASQIKRISPFPEENSNTSDVIWFENEVNFGKKSRERQQIGKERVHVAVSPSLYSEDEEIRISSDESFSSTACTVGATQSENLEENLTGKGKLSNTKDSETPHEKRLVQKKITECFLKK